MAETPSLIGELKRRMAAMGGMSPFDVARVSEELQHSRSAPVHSSLSPKPEGKRETKVFANYIAESSKQEARYELLKSCFLGHREKMSSALTELRVNAELPIPFYSWEYVLVFENPDYPGLKQSTITLQAAENHFATCFQGEAGTYGYQQDVNRQFERRAFLDAFSTLPECTVQEPKWKYIQFKKPQPSKAVSKGGFLRMTQDGLWTSENFQPRDYMTLIRNVIQTKLALHVGLKTRLLLSASGQYIYMLLLADEIDLQNEAERVSYPLQMQLGASDLESLEPCDVNFRPLSEVKSEGFDTLQKDIRSIQMYIYSDIESFQPAKHEECERYIDIKLDAEGISPEQWMTYREFLEIVRTGLAQLKTMQIPTYLKFIRHQQIIEKAYEEVNTAHPKAKIYSLWDRLKISMPLSAYSRYLRNIDTKSGIDTLERICHTDYWQRHRLDTPNSETLFTSADRVKLIDSMVNSQINIKKLEKLKLIHTHFPLHRIWEIESSNRLPQELLQSSANSYENVSLHSRWKLKLVSLYLPLELIRRYFGEKVGFYFLYLHTYTMWLAGLSVMGVIYFVTTVVQIDKIASVETEELYCFLTIAWSSLFLELWKRKQEKFAVHWGQTSFEEVEIQRPEFKGKLRRSPVNDNLYEMHYAAGKRLIFQLLGLVISLVFVGVTAIAIGSILYKRYLVRQRGGIMFLHYDLSGAAFGVINAIQIQIFNKVFEVIAYWTTELENYRSQSDFEDSFIVKCYMFQIVNSYASIVYVAFFQTRFEGCYALLSDGSKQPRSCMYDLQIQLAAIYFVHFVKNLLLMGYAEYKRWKHQSDSRRVQWQMDLYSPLTLRAQLEREYARTAYVARGIDGTFEDYLELMTQYGYVTMFAVAFPLAPILACFNNLLDLRRDRFRLFSLTRRPVPAGARGIGRWLTVLDLTTNMSLFTNAALLCFTMEAYLDWKVMPDKPLIWFAIMIIGVYLVRKGVALFIPDVPHRYALVKKRHAVIVDRHIKKYEPIRRVINVDSEWVDLHVIGTNEAQ